MERRARRPWVVLDLLLVVTVLALVAGLALGLTGAGSSAASGTVPRTPESVRQLAVGQVARAEAEAFLAVDHRDMEPVVQRVLSGATGEFAAEYAADEAELIASVRASRTVATSSARAVGVSDLEKDRAVVLVAADTSVRTARGGEAEVRRHRMRLEVVLEGDRWLVSGLDFVR